MRCKFHEVGPMSLYVDGGISMRAQLACDIEDQQIQFFSQIQSQYIQDRTKHSLASSLIEPYPI